MFEQSFPDYNRLATAEQTQAVLDVVRQITAPLELKTTDLMDEPCTPHHTYTRGNVFLQHYPDGEPDYDDPSSISLACITLRQLDSSEEQYDVQMSAGGLRLRKRLWSSPYWGGSVSERTNTSSTDPEATAIARHLIGFTKDQEAWRMERQFGLDGATAEDAARLLDALRTLTS